MWLGKDMKTVKKKKAKYIEEGRSDSKGQAQKQILVCLNAKNVTSKEPYCVQCRYKKYYQS